MTGAPSRLPVPQAALDAATTTLYRGDWSTDCGNDCDGPEGHAEGCPVHCYCYDDREEAT